MKKVGEIMQEIDEMDKHYKILTNIVDKMENDVSVRKYMMENFQVDAKTMTNIANSIYFRMLNLNTKLKMSEIDID